MQVDQPRPPYVRFQMHDIEDRAASQAAGHYVSKPVPFAHITPAGSKDIIERNAEEWLEDLVRQVDAQRIPASWVDQFRAAYKAWLHDEEPPVNGTPLRNWPVISPGQYKTLRDLRVLTVEDLAAANEETISRFGMGARALKAKAVEWLAAAKNQGTSVEEVTSLRLANERLQADVGRLTEQLAGMAAALAAAGVKLPNAPVASDKEVVTL